MNAEGKRLRRIAREAEAATRVLDTELVIAQGRANDIRLRRAELAKVERAAMLEAAIFTGPMVSRSIQNGRVVRVANSCTGEPECIELRVETWRDENRNGLPVQEIEVHMNYADARWIRRMLKGAIADRERDGEA